MKVIARPVNPLELKASTRSGYPEPFRSRVVPREKRALGDAAGLTRIGVNYTVLKPGLQSSMRHWHTHEDELVYVLSGEVVLVTDAGEQPLKAGQYAGFPAGHADGHHLINRSSEPAVYLEISNRDAEDAGHYPDIDLRWNAPDARGKYSHKDGRSY
ncbi:MAG: cupin domain-containing protein [Gammaproteobacteria bacterium]|nr:cupin domain-containing protein [Gammaproteobacteria bacterium]